MKYIFSIILFTTLILNGCKEEPPTIDFTDNSKSDTGLVDTMFLKSQPSSPQLKNVLIEDFTGVRCPNCPDAQTKAKAYAAANPGRVILTANYTSEPNSLTRPYNFGSNLDMRTKYATDLYTLLGKSNGLPSGAVDRVLYPGETGTLIQNSDNWSGYGNQRLALTPSFNLDIQNTYDGGSRTLKVRITAEATKFLNDTVSLTVSLVENKLIAPQETRTDIDTNYEHEHVLRALLTSFQGKELKQPYQAGTTYIKEFRFVLPAGWKEENIYTVAYIHRSGSGYEVHQVQQKKIK